MQITIKLKKIAINFENKNSNFKIINKYEIEIKITCQENTK